MIISGDIRRLQAIQRPIQPKGSRNRPGASDSRTRAAGEVVRALVGRGVYSGSREDLTPIRLDAWGLLPLSDVIVRLLYNLALANRLSAHTVADYSLTPKAVATICSIEDR